ncbi:MAG TPA: hypothetical protein DCZ04_15455 [Syntrophorhabdus aromaticivorans]|nr:hypothetical protein [Syntrophorhabdus aromaticivorans]
MKGTPKQKHFQEPLFKELKKDYCYVCYQRIKQDEGIHVGRDMWRHRKCKPGSRRWLKSKVGQENPLPHLPRR